MKRLLLILIALFSIITIIEVGLKLTIGLGKPPIYIPDEEIGYLLAPNLLVRRFGNRIAINQYSMRSEEIAYQRADTTVRVLLLGDSIANGAWWTDQEETISSLIKYQLRSALKAKVEDRRTKNPTAKAVRSSETLNKSILDRNHLSGNSHSSRL